MGSPPKPNKVGLVGKGGTAKRLNFCPLKGKMKDTRLVPTQSADAFVRCCPIFTAFLRPKQDSPEALGRCLLRHFRDVFRDTAKTSSERLLRRKKDVSAKQDSSRQNHAEKAARFCVRTHKRRLPNVFRDAKKTSSETSRKTPLRPEKTLLQDKT